MFQQVFTSGTKLGESVGLKDYFSSITDAERRVFREVFPETVPPQKDHRVVCALTLNFLVEQPAKGIRSIRSEPSKREVIDALHIAYALGCDLFLTTDASTATKYKLLSDFWGTKGSVREVRIEKIQ
jgi:hypothetical protein